MQITFLGATGTVTGSRYLVEGDGSTFLVDCGLFQGLKQLRLRNREPLPFSPASLDAVILTHAHLDHSGYLPLLVRNGFRGPVYCTPATRDLCAVLLPDSGHLQEEEAETANRYGYSKHNPALPLYTREDAVRSLDRFETIDFGVEFSLPGDVSIRFGRAGHMLGSAFVRVVNQGSSLVFSGDLGRLVDPLLRPAESVDEADHLVVESTYGDRLHSPEDPLDEIESVIKRTVARGGSVVIPSFAVGRAQTILLCVHDLIERGRIPNVPVFLDSPMAGQATRVFLDHAEETRLSPEKLAAVCRTAEVTESVEESKKISRMTVPRIIISASGMATGGRVVHHIKALAPDERNTILFAGYQAAGTRGAKIMSGASTVKIHGGHVPVRAEVQSLDNVSAHGDYTEIISWMRHLGRAPRNIFITHGEPAAADALRVHIRESLGWEATVPEYRATYSLSGA